MFVPEHIVYDYFLKKQHYIAYYKEILQLYFLCHNKNQKPHVLNHQSVYPYHIDIQHKALLSNHVLQKMRIQNLPDADALHYTKSQYNLKIKHRHHLKRKDTFLRHYLILHFLLRPFFYYIADLQFSYHYHANAHSLYDVLYPYFHLALCHQ